MWATEMIKKLIVDSIHRRGFLLVKRKDFIRPHNFRSLIEGYEQLLNETIAREHPIPENARRPKLLAKLEGTEPGEAYYIIRALLATEEIEGDVCEFGVHNGRTSALMANELASSNKKLHLFDSFEGLPKPTDKDTLKDDIFGFGTMEAYTGAMAVPMDSVLENLSDVGFPPSRFVIHKGWFEELLPDKLNFPQHVSFAYVDFDLYEPIKVVLNFLDTVMPSGGCIIVDDYNFFSTGAKTAVDEFCAEQNSSKERYSLFVPNPRFGYFAILTKKA